MERSRLGQPPSPTPRPAASILASNHILGSIGPTYTATTVAGQCIIDILTHPGGPKGVLKAVPERIKHAIWIRECRRCECIAQTISTSLPRSRRAVRARRGKRGADAPLLARHSSTTLRKPSRTSAGWTGTTRREDRVFSRVPRVSSSVMAMIVTPVALSRMMSLAVSGAKQPCRAPVYRPRRGSQYAASPRPPLGRALRTKTAELNRICSSALSHGSRSGSSSSRRIRAKGSDHGTSSGIRPLTRPHIVTAWTLPSSLFTVAALTFRASGCPFDHSTRPGRLAVRNAPLRDTGINCRASRNSRTWLRLISTMRRSPCSSTKRRSRARTR